MFRKNFAFIAVLSLLFSLVNGVFGSVIPARAASCSAEQGQDFIDAALYEKAIREFTCVIAAGPTEVEGYRGRIEAQLLLGRYSDALLDYTRVTALVIPAHTDAKLTIYAGYAARLAEDPESISALTGASFGRWYFFEYNATIHLINDLLAVQPDNLFGNLFRGSSRLLKGVTVDRGIADIEYALALDPDSPDVRWVVADAYTYGLPDPQRAFAEATLALDGGLDTPRVHAILASSYLAFGDQQNAALHIQRHIELVTSEYVPTAPLAQGSSLSLDLVPGRTFDIPLSVTAGETLSIMTSSHDYWDSILLLLGPDGTPVLGSDDYKGYMAGFEWVAWQTGTYHLQVTFFESVNYGVLVVERK
jgi:tetratricopeptide (TPR) repeat protein